MTTPSNIRSHVAPGRGALVLDSAALQDRNVLSDLSQRLGITMDSLVPPNFAAGIPNALQFLQTFLPGVVRVVTTPRKIDELIGIDTVGSWEDEEILVRLMESLGVASPYTDLANIPLASYNPGIERRTVVRFEQGFRTGPLEEARTSRADIDSRGEKRTAAIASLDFTRNEVGFFGYNNGANRTFGLLNDPGLPAAVAVPAGAGGDTEWDSKTFLEIVSDLRTILEGIRSRSGGTVDPTTTSITLALPDSAMGAMGMVSDFGNSVSDWLQKTYSRVRIVGVPQLEDAAAGESMAIAWADSAPEDDGSTDGGRTWQQLVPERVRMLGSETGAKHYVEDHVNATAGVILKRPYLVYVASGV